MSIDSQVEEMRALQNGTTESALASAVVLPLVRARRFHPPRMERVELSEGRWLPRYRDRELKLIQEFNDYAIFKSNELFEESAAPGSKSYNKGMERIAYTLSKLSEYLSLAGKSWRDIDDEELACFKRWYLNGLKNDPISRTLETAKSTINIRLKVVYEFLWWAQEYACLAQHLVGLSRADKVRSAIVEMMKTGKMKGFSGKRVYPLCFRGFGETSRLSRDQYWASDEDIDRLEQWFRERRGTIVAERNVLLLRLAQCSGWRRGSLASLTTAEFSDELLREAEEKRQSMIEVTPGVQKFGRKYRRPISIMWFRVVNSYINNGRRQLLAELGIAETDSSKALFLSEKTGAPLSPEHMTAELSLGFRTLGAPKGAGVHAVRRNYGDNKGSEIIAGFAESNVALSFENLSATLKMELDHSSDRAWEVYVRGVTKAQATSHAAKQGEALSAKDAEIAGLRAQIASLQSRADKGNVSTPDISVKRPKRRSR